MSGVFASGKNGLVNEPSPPATGLRVQNSAQGAIRSLVCGQQRVAGNIIWYGGFSPTAVWQPGQGSGGGGKGGGGGGGGSLGTITYTYSAYVAIGIAAGPIAHVISIFDQRGGIGSLAAYNATAFLGDYAQQPWGYIASTVPSQALAYRGLAYVAFGPLQLGAQTDLPNFTFEVIGAINTGVAGQWDADPRDWINYLLTDAHEGVDFPAGFLGPSTLYSQACKSTGLVISHAITAKQSAQQILQDLALATNADFRWSNGLLEIIPYYDEAIGTFVPNTTPVYDLVDDDYLPSSSEGEPISVTRRPRTEVLNTVSVEYLDRSNNYNPVAIDAKDEAAIEVYGKLPSDLRTFHQFALSSAAAMSAALQLNREQIVASYTIKLGPWAILADVIDLLTLSRVPMNMLRQGVRITEIQEDDDGSLTFSCEEYLGTSSAPAYGKQATAGYYRNLNEDPGGINPPLIFEPTAELLGGASLEIWGAISGLDPTKWGGYNVFASFDGGDNYALIGDTKRGAARMGFLTAPLATVTVNVTGPTIDETHTLAVDLTESASALLTATQNDVLALATSCYIDGEIVAYRDATLTGPFAYNLSYLVRGAYGTETSIVTHDIGTPFARLDLGIFRVPYDQSMIGSTIYLKFQSINQYGGGLQELSDLAAYPYVVTGLALKSPLPVVQNVRTQFTDRFEYIYWDDVVDFRTGIRYQIFKGDTFAGAQQVGDNAHAPFIAFGTGTYWIRAYAQPVPGLYVYGEAPASIAIVGNMLVSNLVYQSDQQAAGWLGTFSNGVGRSGSNIRLGGAGNILTEADFLNIPDVLNYGGIVSSGTYTIPTSDIVDVGYTANCYVNATWIGTGAPAGQNILTIADILAQPDILGSASTQYVNVKVQIRTAVGDVGDLYAEADLYLTPDLYLAGLAWTDWKDYVPGVYPARWVDFRLLLTSIDPNTEALALAFSFAVTVTPRIDHYPPQTVPIGGLSIVFEPDDASVAAPFNGGPPVGGTVHNQPLPIYQITAPNAAGLSPVIDALTLAGMTFHWEDGSGTHVAVPNTTIVVEGF